MEFIIEIISKITFFIFACAAPFGAIGVFFFIYFFCVKKIRPPKKEFISTYKKTNILKRIFIDFPKRFVLDILERNPNEFGIYGFHLFVGEQGSGKTVSVVEFLNRIKAQYPLCKIATNFEYKEEDSKIENADDIVFNNNGIYGQADVIDEVQNWFSCNQSKNFPPEMIQEITQQRKQRKILIGTTQRFERMAKPLREQVNYLYVPITLFGCLTIVRVYKPKVDEEGYISKSRFIKAYFFVHSDEIRNSFDTFHKIKKQTESGFVVHDNSETSVNIYNIVNDKNVRRKK